MKLATIRQERTCEADWLRSDDADDEDSSLQTNAEEADALFREGLTALADRDDKAALHIFCRLCDYKGESPASLLSTARMVRDFLDPERPAEEHAKALFALFSPRLISIDSR